MALSPTWRVNYRLTAPDDAQTLVFSSVGYTSEEVEIGDRTTINLEMAPDIQSLSEIVVVGYGYAVARGGYLVYL